MAGSEITAVPRDIRDLKVFSALVYVIAILVAMVSSRFEILFSVALGGAFAIANLAYLVKLSAIILSNRVNPGSARILTALTFYARFALMAFAVYYFTKSGWINFPALIAGFSVTVISIPSFYLFRSLRPGMESKA
jgi:hypothetical protein